MFVYHALPNTQAAYYVLNIIVGSASQNILLSSNQVHIISQISKTDLQPLSRGAYRAHYMVVNFAVIESTLKAFSE